MSSKASKLLNKVAQAQNIDEFSTNLYDIVSLSKEERSEFMKSFKNRYNEMVGKKNSKFEVFAVKPLNDVVNDKKPAFKILFK